MESAALPAAQTAQRAPGRRRLSDRARAERKTAYMLCAPAVVVMLAVTGYPILYALWLSLHKFDLRFRASFKKGLEPVCGPALIRVDDQARARSRRPDTPEALLVAFAAELQLEQRPAGGYCRGPRHRFWRV